MAEKVVLGMAEIKERMAVVEIRWWRW